jgi:hypothetical protein
MHIYRYHRETMMNAREKHADEKHHNRALEVEIQLLKNEMEIIKQEADSKVNEMKAVVENILSAKLEGAPRKRGTKLEIDILTKVS